MQELFIDTDNALGELINALQGSSWLAIDTEFIRERSYYPRLCLIQVANADIAAAIDPLAFENPEPLKKLLCDPSIVKIFHAGHQDLEIFLQLWGQLPTPLFDTQPAAALLGLGDQVGYGNLVQKVLNVNLAKDQSRTDWCRRPLHKGQLRYALDDVIYLGQLYTEMKRRLQAQQRLSWLDTDFQQLSSPHSYQLDPMNLWQKIRGRQHLKGQKLAILQQLAAWRERQAMKRDRPRRWIIKDEVMLEMARRAPKSLAELKNVRGVDAGFIRHNGDAILKVIEKGRQTPQQDWPADHFKSNKPSAQEEALLDILNAALRLIALDAGLSPQAIASRKDLQALVQNNEKSILRKGWRYQVAGRPLLELIQGKRNISIKNGLPELMLDSNDSAGLTSEAVSH